LPAVVFRNAHRAARKVTGLGLGTKGSHQDQGGDYKKAA
jgi:hypothetical protein